MPEIRVRKFMATKVGLVLIACSLLLIALKSSAAATMSKEQAEVLTAQGNQFYQDKQYDKAVDAYQQVISGGFEGTSLYYNLGDAYYREGKLGFAILYFEKALRLSPGDNDVLHNLKIANARTVDKIDAMPRFFIFQWWESLLALMTVPGWAYTAYVFYIILLLSVGLFFFARKPGIQRYSVFSGFASFLFLIVTVSLLSVKLNRELSVRSAIVVEPTVTVKLSPDPTSNDAFVVHEGLKVREINSVGDWVLIRLQDGKEGWVEENEVSTI